MIADIFDNLVKESNASWSTRAFYFDYHGDELHGTHYHESYHWLENYKAFEGQFAKLQIQKGDWIFARTALHFMVDVRENKCSVSEAGGITGSFSQNVLKNYHASIFPPGEIALPVMPVEYRPLSISGPLRDLASEASDLLSERSYQNPRSLYLETFAECAARIRREVRIEIHRKLEENHPACKNLEEIIVRYQPGDDDGLAKWLKEFEAATWEAARCIEYQAS